MRPTVLRTQGYRLFFFSREEEWMHIHVSCGDGEAKFWLDPAIELAHNHRLKPKQLRQIGSIIGDNLQEIVDAWHDHFGN